MNVAVIGATGRTGRVVVEEALRRGHAVTALVRRPDAVALHHERLTPLAADVLNRHSLVEGLARSETVVSTLGIGRSKRPTAVYSQGTENLVAAMGINGVGRLAVVSASPVGPR